MTSGSRAPCPRLIYTAFSQCLELVHLPPVKLAVRIVNDRYIRGVLDRGCASELLAPRGDALRWRFVAHQRVTRLTVMFRIQQLQRPFPWF